jgi:hypothetical protein
MMMCCEKKKEKPLDHMDDSILDCITGLDMPKLAKSFPGMSDWGIDLVAYLTEDASDRVVPNSLVENCSSPMKFCERSVGSIVETGWLQQRWCWRSNGADPQESMPINIRRHTMANAVQRARRCVPLLTLEKQGS